MKLMRGLATLIQTPFAAAADVLTLGKMGEGSFTANVWRGAKEWSDFEETLDALERIKELKK